MTCKFILQILRVFWIFSNFAAGSGTESSSLSPPSDDAKRAVNTTLRRITYTVKDGEERVAFAYVRPHVTTFYNGMIPPSSTEVPVKFKRRLCKMVNMGNETVSLYLKDSVNSKRGDFIASIKSMSDQTFNCHPGEILEFAKDDNPNQILSSFAVHQDSTSLFMYDPYLDPMKPKILNNLQKYQLKKWRQIADFNDQYEWTTGRSYLRNEILEAPPHNHRWSATHFGKQYDVKCRETHFDSKTHDDRMEDFALSSSSTRILQIDEPPILSDHRTLGQTSLNLKLVAISCGPEIFEVQDFLSEVEIAHLFELSGSLHFTKDSSANVQYSPTKATIPGLASPIVQAIHRRAAELLRVDPVNVEQMQLVNYSKGQKDVVDFDKQYESNKLATLLVFLNDDVEGGATTVPRWLNAETFDPLRIEPERGKALLIYAQLPDGNRDELAEFGSEVVRNGDKWILQLTIRE